MTDQTIVFKNNLPNLTVLKLFSQDFTVVKAKLQQKIKQAPMMFIGMQVVVDISAFDKEDALSLDIDSLVQFLQGEGINPVAAMTDRAAFREMLIKKGLGAIPVLENNTERKTAVQPKQDTVPTAEIVETKAAKTTEYEEPRKTFDNNQPQQTTVSEQNQIIRHPIRSGQRIYSQGDLTIVGAVSHGAEVIANGSIHVYGKLRGRAIAGAKGDDTASIFCQSLDAELVSIAGNYKQLEDISEEYRQKRVQISLDAEKIVFSSL